MIRTLMTSNQRYERFFVHLLIYVCASTRDAEQCSLDDIKGGNKSEHAAKTFT